MTSSNEIRGLLDNAQNAISQIRGELDRIPKRDDIGLRARITGALLGYNGENNSAWTWDTIIAGCTNNIVELKNIRSNLDAAKTKINTLAERNSRLAYEKNELTMSNQVVTARNIELHAKVLDLETQTSEQSNTPFTYEQVMAITGMIRTVMSNERSKQPSEESNS